MSDKIIIYPQSSIARIDAAVKKTEALPRPLTARPSTWRPSQSGFYAMIQTTNASDGENNAYSWWAMSPSGAGAWMADSTIGSGTYDGEFPNLPARCRDGCPFIQWGVPVVMEATPGQLFFTFDAPGGVVLADIVSFTPNGEGTATINNGSQQIKFADSSGGTVADGTTNCTLSYQRGTPGFWLLISVPCS